MAFVVADTSEQWLRLLAEPTAYILRSMEDWEKFVALNEKERIALYAGTRYEGVDPFKGVPNDAIQAFTRTLIFKGGGLGHANYSALAQRMSGSQLAALWTGFGISDQLTADYMDKKCAGQGTCTPSLNDICTSNC
jgi:hypothetical protein